MVAQPITQPDQSEQEIFELWQVLSDEHRQIVLQVAQAFVLSERQSTIKTEPQPETPADDEETRRAEQIRRNQGLIAWAQARLAEYEHATPEELEEGQAELEDIQRALDANRYPEPPLFA